MFRKVFAATVAMLAFAGAAQASTYSWDVSGPLSGSGSTGGTHTVTAANGDGSTITFSGAPSPSIEATGQTGAVGGRYSNARASYEYSFKITSLNSIAKATLYDALILGGDPTPDPIATAIGYTYLAGTPGSYAQATVKTQIGGSAYADCDSGAYGQGCGLTNYSFDVYYDFHVDCPGADAQHPCTLPPAMFTPTVTLSLNLEADVFGGSNEHVFAFVDPTITLNDAFFTHLGLSPADFQPTFSEGEGNVASPPNFPGFGAAAAPEPATWAMMLLGFGALGAALRRRRPTLAAS